MSGFNVTPATVGMVMAELGGQGYHPMPRVDDHRFSDDVLEVALVAEQGVAHVLIVADLRTGQLTVKIDGAEIPVKSLFNNGSGFFFRNCEDHEFLYIDVQDQKVVYNPERGRTAKWDTQVAWRTELVDNQIESLRADTKRVEAELEEARNFLAEAIALLSTGATSEELATFVEKATAVIPPVVEQKLYI